VEKSGISILLADNQPLTVAGLRSFLADRADLQVVDQVQDSRELVNAVNQHRPDLLIADYNIPGFITLDDLEQLTREVSPLNILVISSDNDKPSILKTLQLGVKGYLTKACSKEEVLMAIQSVAKGEKFFCHKILDIIMEKHFSPQPENCDPTILTVRETEILKLIAKGRSTQQIADSLHLSPHTVQTHRKSIIRKLHIKSPTEFVIYAMDLGIIKK
jgi:two-component system, NarL family, invasion response regulator UvrY